MLNPGFMLRLFNAFDVLGNSVDSNKQDRYNNEVYRSCFFILDKFVMGVNLFCF